jgi:hypothetical protein
MYGIRLIHRTSFNKERSRISPFSTINSDTSQSQTMESSTRGRIFVVLLFTTIFEVQITTNMVLYEHWEILKDLCAVWSLQNVGLIYSGSSEHGEWRRILLQNANLSFAPSPHKRTTMFALLIQLHNTSIRVLKSCPSICFDCFRPYKGCLFQTAIEYTNTMNQYFIN